MVLSRHSVAGLLSLAALCAVSAQSSPFGTYSVSTRYDDGVRTSDTAIRLRSAGGTQVKVDRTARFTHAPDGATLRWRGEGTLVSSKTVRVDYRISRSGGFTAALAADDYQVLAFYRIEGDRLREVLINGTPVDAQAGWTEARSDGERDNAFVLAARGQASALVGVIMNYRTDVADYYAPGDDDHYAADLRESGFYFERALWTEVPALPGFPAAKTLRAHNVDPTYVVEPGAGYVLLDANANVLATLYQDETGELFDRDGAASAPAPMPPAPNPAPPAPAPVVINCPLGGLPVAQLAQRAKGASTRIAGFMMDFYANVADYYSLGDEQQYAEDEQRLRQRLATGISWAEVPVPAGYQAYKALRAVTVAGEEHVTVLFDCNGQILETILHHFGDDYDSDDV